MSSAEEIETFPVLRRALDDDDLAQLRAHCRVHLAKDTRFRVT